MHTISDKQLLAIARLWDATDPFVEEAEYGGCDQTKLIAARDAMGEAFPADHPLRVDSNNSPKGV